MVSSVDLDVSLPNTCHLSNYAGNYYLTGLVHVSEVSWDLVQDASDVLTEGDEVRVKVISIDR